MHFILREGGWGEKRARLPKRLDDGKPSETFHVRLGFSQCCLNTTMSNECN